jgi:crotonobetainyl-CoA:carnitine CoA-transferase CaiB-like acyl-CoA transferase
VKKRSDWDNGVASEIAQKIQGWRVQELLSALENASVWAEACCVDGEKSSLRDEDLVRLGTIYSAQHPQFGMVRQIGPLARLSGSRPAASRHAPLVGEHTDVILTELGYTSDQVKALRERKVVA